MSNVIELKKHNESLVKALESLLIEARSGRVTSMAAIVLKNHETDFVIEPASEQSTLETLGALELLKNEIMNLED